MTASERFAQLIRLPTVSSYDPNEEDSVAFDRFPGLLAELYPSAHKAMKRELIGNRSVVYQWAGSDPSLEPVLGMAHYDVVPPGDPEKWGGPAFSGDIADGRIHGRGSLDDKGMLAAWMEAADRLAAKGFRPVRTLYLVFGGDEETSGIRGAGMAASVFAERGLRFAFVLDEGGAVATEQLDAFTDRPVALIGAAEKGYLTLKITSEGLPGHASAPPEHSAIGRLSTTLAALESHHFPVRLTEMPVGMLRSLGRNIGGLKGFLLRHPGFFRNIILKILAGNPTMVSMIRTTLASTIIRGGERDNVIPETAEARVNLRILPGETVASASARVKKIISRAVDGGITVEAVEGSVFEPVPSSPTSGVYWDLLQSQAEKTWPDVIVTPYLMIATTDSRWYRDLTDTIYRFIPMEAGRKEIQSVHAPNESVSLDAWGKSVDFLEGIIRNMHIGGAC